MSNVNSYTKPLQKHNDFLLLGVNESLVTSCLGINSQLAQIHLYFSKDRDVSLPSPQTICLHPRILKIMLLWRRGCSGYQQRFHKTEDFLMSAFLSCNVAPLHCASKTWPLLCRYEKLGLSYPPLTQHSSCCHFC